MNATNKVRMMYTVTDSFVGGYEIAVFFVESDAVAFARDLNSRGDVPRFCTAAHYVVPGWSL